MKIRGKFHRINACSIERGRIDNPGRRSRRQKLDFVITENQPRQPRQTQDHPDRGHPAEVLPETMKQTHASLASTLAASQLPV
jgi:hypothetical protein